MALTFAAISDQTVEGLGLRTKLGPLPECRGPCGQGQTIGRRDRLLISLCARWMEIIPLPSKLEPAQIAPAQSDTITKPAPGSSFAASRQHCPHHQTARAALARHDKASLHLNRNSGCDCHHWGDVGTNPVFSGTVKTLWAVRIRDRNDAAAWPSCRNLC